MRFEQYVAARGQSLLRFAFVLTGDAHLAEDLVQTALMKAHGRWRRVSAADHPDAYVRRALLNAHLDTRRRRSSQELPALSEGLGSGEVAPGDHAVALVERSAMWQALATLPPKQRAVLVLRFYEDLDDAAIAHLMGVAEVTVRSNASRALATLRSTWAAASGEQLKEGTP